MINWLFACTRLCIGCRTCSGGRTGSCHAQLFITVHQLQMTAFFKGQLYPEDYSVCNVDHCNVLWIPWAFYIMGWIVGHRLVSAMKRNMMQCPQFPLHWRHYLSSHHRLTSGTHVMPLCAILHIQGISAAVSSDSAYLWLKILMLHGYILHLSFSLPLSLCIPKLVLLFQF